MRREPKHKSPKPELEDVPSGEIDRERQDKIALNSHQNYSKGRNNGFFDDLILPLDGVKEDTIPREKTSLEQLAKLNPVFDKESDKG